MILFQCQLQHNFYVLTYNFRGHLVHKGHTYSCHSRNPLKLMEYWRCTLYKKLRCSSSLTTKHKAIVAQRGEHNHEPPTRLKTFVPRVLS
ncbi:uncharacterized protein pre-mod(mdg4)-AA [Drosophila tropicalis]|uniref:uncharacterized protein pre-mod(mdg4)-AA n=1 Tax=Drosophila tropicalis TaxID=46794 RepID=UPI0035ABE9A1